jgi:hypothetical protein
LRPIFEDAAGRQFITVNMEKIYGAWLLTDAAEQNSRAQAWLAKADRFETDAP